MGETLQRAEVGWASCRGAGWWHPYAWQLVVSEQLRLKQRGEHPQASLGKYEYMHMHRESTGYL